MSELAPIILFVYNRSEHTQKTLNYLSKNQLAEKSKLYIYCDGPKENCSSEELEEIKKVREIIKTRQWCGEVNIIEHDINKGLANSIITGVGEIINKHGKIIVLEDDILTSTNFLKFMNNALNMYEKEEKALSIGACNFFANDESVPDCFFVPIPDCWGWATWKDRWALFEPDGKKLLKQLKEKNLMDKFNLFGAYDFESMLIDQTQEKNNSWAIRWQAVAYIHDKLSLYPRIPTSHNFGFDQSGTHTYTFNKVYSTLHFFYNPPSEVIKVEVEEDDETTKKMIEANGIVFNSYQGGGRRNLFIRLIRKVLSPFR